MKSNLSETQELCTPGLVHALTQARRLFLGNRQPVASRGFIDPNACESGHPIHPNHFNAVIHEHFRSGLDVFPARRNDLPLLLHKERPDRIVISDFRHGAELH